MNNYLGIDIGQSSVKVVLVNKEKEGNFFLENIGEAKLELNESSQNDSGKRWGEIGKAIKTIISDNKIKTKQVVAALPENEVISRLVRLPPLKDSEIMDALRFEAETFVPYPLEEVSLDYEIIEKDEAGRLNVFVIAARNELISAYIKLFKSLGLDLMAIESPSVAFRRMARNSVGSIERLVVLNIGEKFSDIFNVYKGNVYFSRSLPIGGESLTRAVSLGLGLDLVSAEEYKKAYGIKEEELEGKIRVATMPVFNSITDEVRKAIALFVEDSGGKTVQLLVLSGGGANMPGMAEELTRTLGVEVQISQPFVNIDVTKIQSPFNLNVEGCRFSLAVGLSLRE
ncbi:MAG: type IV pilus assembly protein PilM [Candidatus Shapirobacteria bacterium]|nr:type IV pilus assembly protein PilM [Candidatus Shapirobacteria bacterium]